MCSYYVPPWLRLHFWQQTCSFKRHRFFLLVGSAPRCCEPDHSVRQVYGWFLHLYQISVAAGLCGYLLLILEVFGVGRLLRPIGVPATLSLLMVWYAAVLSIQNHGAGPAAPPFPRSHRASCPPWASC